MLELRGIPRYSGIAMAVVVRVDISGGLSGVPENVMRRGLKALKMGLSNDDLPEVIIACDLLAIGSAIRIPGIRTIGIIAQNDDQPSIPIAIPCVAGVQDLFKSIENEQIAIVDGNEGLVLLDPDAQTVVQYQNIMEPESSERVFLESVHLPAHTQDGRIIMVAALISSLREAEMAISQGADQLIVRLPADDSDPRVEMLQTVLALAAGKLLSIILDEPDEEIKKLTDQFIIGSRIEYIRFKDIPELLTRDGVQDAVNAGIDLVTVASWDVAATKELIRSLPWEDIDTAVQ
jgi:hypothetical protein